MTQYGRDYVGNYTIIGASGQVMDPEDVQAEMLVHQISGWSDEDIIGQAMPLLRIAPRLPQAAARLNPRLLSLFRTPAPAVRAAVQQFAPPSQLVPPMQPGPVVMQQPPGPVGLALIPMNNPANVAAGATANITVQPQSIFKPYRLTVDPVIAAFFMIQSLQVGTVPLFDAPGEVACSNFPPNLQQGNLKKVTANPGISLTMVVRNRDGAAHPFFSTMFGEAAPTACG